MYFFPKIFLIFLKIPCVGVYGLPFLPFFQNLKKHVYATNKLHLHMYNVGMFELNSHYEIIHAQWAKKRKKIQFQMKKNSWLQVPSGHHPLDKISKNIDFSLWGKQYAASVNCIFSDFSSMCIFPFMETKMMIIFYSCMQKKLLCNDYFSIFLISNIIYNYFDTFCTKKLPVELLPHELFQSP